jgi:hypothetical protein
LSEAAGWAIIEDRCGALHNSSAKRLLLVCFTERGDERIRIISARNATKEERRAMKSTKPKRDDLEPEYRFNYAKSKPNRFAGRVKVASVAVLLDPDVAQVFKSGESVNTVLRALMTAMPKSQKKR